MILEFDEGFFKQNKEFLDKKAFNNFKEQLKKIIKKEKKCEVEFIRNGFKIVDNSVLIKEDELVKFIDNAIDNIKDLYENEQDSLKVLNQLNNEHFLKIMEENNEKNN